MSPRRKCALPWFQSLINEWTKKTIRTASVRDDGFVDEGARQLAVDGLVLGSHPFGASSARAHEFARRLPARAGETRHRAATPTPRSAPPHCRAGSRRRSRPRAPGKSGCHSSRVRTPPGRPRAERDRTARSVMSPRRSAPAPGAAVARPRPAAPPTPAPSYRSESPRRPPGPRRARDDDAGTGLQPLGDGDQVPDSLRLVPEPTGRRDHRLAVPTAPCRNRSGERALWMTRTGPPE